LIDSIIFVASPLHVCEKGKGINTIHDWPKADHVVLSLFFCQRSFFIYQIHLRIKP